MSEPGVSAGRVHVVGRVARRVPAGVLAVLVLSVAALGDAAGGGGAGVAVAGGGVSGPVVSGPAAGPGPIGAGDAKRSLFPQSFQAPVGTPVPKASGSEATPTTGWSALAPTVGPLALVLVLIVVVGWVLSRLTRGNASLASGSRAPAGILEVLGRYPLGRGQTLVLLKMDQRVLLLAQSAPTRGSCGGVTTLAELRDAQDVASILLKVSESEQTGPASKFNRMLEQFNGEVSGVDARGRTVGSAGALGLLGRLAALTGVGAALGSARPVSWVEGSVAGSAGDDGDDVRARAGARGRNEAGGAVGAELLGLRDRLAAARTGGVA